MCSLVRLVDNDEVDFRSLPARKRLDRADLDRLVAIGARVKALHDADAVDPFRLEGGDRLVNEAECRNDEGDALALSEGAPNDVRRDDGLAGAGRELQASGAGDRMQRMSATPPAHSPDAASKGGARHVGQRAARS